MWLECWFNWVSIHQYFYLKPLSASFYINWSVELGSPKKGVINIEKKDQK